MISVIGYQRIADRIVELAHKNGIYVRKRKVFVWGEHFWWLPIMQGTPHVSLNKHSLTQFKRVQAPPPENLTKSAKDGCYLVRVQSRASGDMLCIDWKRVDMWEDRLRSEASVKNKGWNK